MSMKQPDASAGLDLRMWSGEGGFSQLHIPVFIPLTLLSPFISSLFGAVPQLSSFQHSLQSSWAPATSCSFGHLTHTPCTQAAVPSSPCNAAGPHPALCLLQGGPPSHTGSQLPRDGDARVSLLCLALWLMQFVVFLHCVCKSSPTLFQGEGFAPSNMGRKDCACTTATCIRG